MIINAYKTLRKVQTSRKKTNNFIIKKVCLKKAF